MADHDSPTLVAVDLTSGGAAPVTTVVQSPLSVATGERPRLAGRYENRVLHAFAAARARS